MAKTKPGSPPIIVVSYWISTICRGREVSRPYQYIGVLGNLISFTIRLQCIIHTQDFSTEVKIWGKNGRGCVGGLTQPLMDFFNGGGNVLVEVEHVVEEVVHGLEATEVVCHLFHPVVAVEIRFVEVGYHDVFLHLQVFCHGI